MSVTAEAVRQLRERTGAGMMECKRALVEVGGDLDTAAEFMRKQGLAKADKKATRIAAEGVVVIERDPKSAGRAAMVEVNCETDFVARGPDFQAFVADVVRAALAAPTSELAAVLAFGSPGGESIDERRRALVAKIGENISVRRSAVLESPASLGTYAHGSRIGVLVAVEGGDAELARDLAMHIAASNPRYAGVADVPADVVAKEREILTEQAQQEGKSADIVAKMIEGRLRKALNEMVLTGQPFVKDPEISIEKLLKAAGARVLRFERFEVGAGIERRTEDFAAEVAAQVSAAGGR